MTSCNTIVEKMNFLRAHGTAAEGRIRGTLRGGHIYQGRFYALGSISAGLFSDDVANVRDLKIHKTKAAA